MAYSRQAQKRMRQTATRTERNRARRSRIRTFVRKCEEAISGGDVAQARAALRDAQSELHRGVTKGVMKRNTASRKVARLNARVNGLETPPT